MKRPFWSSLVDRVLRRIRRASCARFRPNALRHWEIALHDGSTIVNVIATNETQARCVAVFGPSFWADAIASGRYLIHPDNVRACMAGDEVSIDTREGAE